MKKQTKIILRKFKDYFISPKKRFESIYKTNHWGDSESISGPGSRIDATLKLRTGLNTIIHDLKIHSIMDAPCGDFNWMKLIDLTEKEYLGIDIVPEIIERNAKLYGRDNIHFLNKNIITDTLPLVDLIICRDCFVHFSIRNILNALDKFVESGSKYLLTTSFENCRENIEIATGGWRKINLTLPPFSFPEPKLQISEHTPGQIEGDRNVDKSASLWNLKDINKSLKIKIQ